MIAKSIITAYLASSFFLFAFPHILHKNTKSILKSQSILRISHRGGPRHTTQNTIQAFKKSESVSDMFQMDVCMTKDKVLVVHHDKDLWRSCGIKEEISQFNLKELPQFKKQIEIHFTHQSRFMETNGQRIPTLDEVFRSFPAKLMNIQLKTPSIESTSEITRLIDKYNRRNITVIGIRNEFSKILESQHPQTYRFCSDGQIVKLMFAYFTGLLPFIKIHSSTLQIPLSTNDFYQWKRRESTNPLKNQLFFSVLKLANYIMIPMIWHLKKRGILTYYWVCNNDQQFQKAIECGASGIMTDEPWKLDQYLRKQYNKNDRND